MHDILSCHYVSIQWCFLKVEENDEEHNYRIFHARIDELTKIRISKERLPKIVQG